MPNIHYNPEAYGLTVVGTASDDNLSYAYDEFIVWQDAAGGLRWASDSGCSCPQPFEDVALDDTGHGTPAEAHAALREWAGSTPGKQASAADLLLKIAMPPPPARNPVQVDPPGCGCTECLTGLYVPLDRATDEQVAELVAGTLSNATSERFTLTTTTTDYLDGQGATAVMLTAEYSGRTWDLTRFLSTGRLHFTRRR